MGLPLSLGHFKVKTVTQGIKRAHVEAGNQPKMHRSLTWKVVKGVDEGVWGIKMWMGLTLS